MAGFRKAKSEQAALKMGFYGAAGSGKTMTALLVAEGLSKLTRKRTAFVDTERGTDFYCQAVPSRGVHPEAFDFDAIYTRSMTDIIRDVKALDQTQYATVVIDSITHVWEAAIAAYAGNTTKIGSIPFHAWAKIKKPYKELIAFLLSSQLHVIFCGRQGNIWEEDEASGELKNVGTKMKAEGETPYEPHILIHMECMRKKDGTSRISAFAEKDRTGVLAGKMFYEPTFNSLISPIIPLLGGVQAHMQTGDEAAAIDAENLAQDDNAKETRSTETLKRFKARIDLCEDKDALKALSKEITPALKATMVTSDVGSLRASYLEREKELAGKVASPRPVNRAEGELTDAEQEAAMAAAGVGAREPGEEG